MNTDIRALQVGQVISDYRIESVLGQGAFGITYLAMDTMLNRKFAIKEYYPREFAHRDSTLTVHAAGSKDDQDTFKWGLQRFLDEARLLARFDHPNIVAVRRFFGANGTAYLVMDYCEGISLDELIKKNGPLGEKDLNKIIAPLLDGLKQVHASNFLHRDIKPANIFIRADGSPVLLDFGAARQELVNHSKSVTSLVTPHYAAFEQYSTQGKQGPWTDIYGLAATLYRAVTGERPLDSPDRIMEDTLVPLSVRSKGKYSNTLLNAIDKGMAVRPVDRPQSIPEWEEQLFGAKIYTPPIEAPKVVLDFPLSPKGSMPTNNVKGASDISRNTVPKITVETLPSSKKSFLLSGAVVALLVLVGSYFVLNKEGAEKSLTKSIDEPAKKIGIIEPKNLQIKTQEPKAEITSPIKDSVKLPPCKEPFVVNAWTDCVGKVAYPNGDSYVGDFKNGKFDGQGKYIYVNGDRYEGGYRNGVSEGQGTYIFANGEKYVGQWLNGKNNGPGTFKQSDGGIYVGNFKDNLRDGSGTLTLPSGLKVVGRYSAGKLVEGTVSYPDKSRYKGFFNSDGKYNGEGVLYAPNGTVVSYGTWANGELIGGKSDDGLLFSKCKDRADEANKSLPKAVDKITNWVTTTCRKDGGGLAYVMTMQLTTDDKFTNDQLNAIAYNKVKNSLCADPTQKERSKFLDIEYRYLAKDGAYMGTLKYPRNSCP
jgi:serine/threonine protein kinase